MNYFIIIEDKYNKTFHTSKVNKVLGEINIGRAKKPEHKTIDINPPSLFINQNVLRVGRDHAYIRFDVNKKNWIVRRSFNTKAPTIVKNNDGIEREVETEEIISNTDEILLGINREISIKIQNDETQADKIYIDNASEEESESTKELPDWFDYENPYINGTKIKFKSKQIKWVFDELLRLLMSPKGGSKTMDSKELTLAIKKRNNEHYMDVSDSDISNNRNRVAYIRKYFKSLYIEDPKYPNSGKLKKDGVFICIEKSGKAGYFLNFDHNECQHKDE